VAIRIPVIPYEEQDSFPVPLPPIPTADDPYVLEDHPMNTVNDDDYEIYVDHEDGQRIKWKPKVKKKEIFIGPDGRPLPEDVQEQIRGYGTEQDTMSFLESFIDDALIARGRSVFSNDALDKQKDIRDYLNNDQKVRELLIKQGKIKA